MNINIEELTDDLFLVTSKMITELMNYHRKLTNAPKEYWQTDEQSKVTLQYWKEHGTIYNVFLDDEPVGFFYVKFGGQNAAWLEDIFVLEQYRGRGIGKFAMQKLDELMINKNVVAMFVDVIPRNTSAIKLYKNDDVELLGFNFKKY